MGLSSFGRYCQIQGSRCSHTVTDRAIGLRQLTSSLSQRDRKTSNLHRLEREELPVTEPPLLMKKTRDELLSYVDTPFSSNYPSHTQRVETGVKLTTAGAARVVGQKRQVGECLMVETSRKKSPGRVTRKRFNI